MPGQCRTEAGDAIVGIPADRQLPAVWHRLVQGASPPSLCPGVPSECCSCSCGSMTFREVSGLAVLGQGPGVSPSPPCTDTWRRDLLRLPGVVREKSAQGDPRKGAVECQPAATLSARGPGRLCRHSWRSGPPHVSLSTPGLGHQVPIPGGRPPGLLRKFCSQVVRG